ncbi:MAG: hybrid sensor histidine kinase/response regulator, partial [Gammaproteobacteria bacterium]
ELARRNAELQIEVTERKRAEERLLEQDRRKDEFLAMLAHELRNPLASIANALAALKLSAIAPHPLHGAMSRQLALLVRLIDDLLDVARIRRGKLALKVGQSTLNATLDAAIETVFPLLKRGEHPLNVRRLPADVLLHVDHERLSQVFSNLLNNATKYSDAYSPIDIEVSINADWIEVAVIDRGIGLTAEQCEQIFGLFAQVDTALERSRGGLGIGLTLARHIVDMHGGELMATSDGLGRGSRFIVRLPFQPVPSLAAPNTPGYAPSAPCRVLIVDDNVDSADSLAVLLQLLGHETRCIYDARAAAKEAETFSPDVIFLDIGMPGMSGYDVARQLRAQPLVALTGWGQPEDRKRTSEAGFDHHLVKPTDPQAIERILRELKPRIRTRT